MRGTHRAPERAEAHTELRAEAPPSWRLRAKGLTGRNACLGRLLISHFWDGSWNAFSGNHLAESKPAKFLSGTTPCGLPKFVLVPHVSRGDRLQFAFSDHSVSETGGFHQRSGQTPRFRVADVRLTRGLIAISASTRHGPTRAG